MTIFQILGCGLVGLSFLGFWKVLNSILNSRRALKNPVEVNAVIIHLENSSTEGDVSEWLTPTVKYPSEDGKMVEKKLVALKETKNLKVGKKLKLIYEKGNPHNWFLPGEKQWDSISNFVALAFLLFVFAVGTVLYLGRMEFKPVDPVEKPLKNRQNQ